MKNMTIYDLKPKFQALLRPIVDNLAKNKITPNQVTWVALELSVVAGGLIGFTHGVSWTLLLISVVCSCIFTAIYSLGVKSFSNSDFTYSYFVLFDIYFTTYF